MAPVKSVLFCSPGSDEVNSNGALVAMPTGDVCMIADPERCWAQEKRRKYLANQVGTPEMFSLQDLVPTFQPHLPTKVI